MTSDDFEAIESGLGVKLPPEYRQLLARYPSELFQSVAAFELYDDPRFVINETMDFRVNGFGGKSRSPGEVLVIGDDGCGTYCCLDMSQEPATVVGYDHETDSYTEFAWSLDGWVKSLMRRNQSRGGNT
jgi:hypothetical protein